MLSSMTTSFVSRLRARDEGAWYELWETFGPVLRSQLTKWGKGRIGAETVRDLSQETMAALSDSIDRFDPSRGARFSTWLLAIAKHTLGDEIDRRMAQKRGSGKRGTELNEEWMSKGPGISPDGEYEAAVFRAKVHAALRLAEKGSDFGDFEVYRMRVLEGRPGKEVADELGLSEPTVSRRLARVRVVVRDRLAEVMETYSFTPEEFAEMKAAGLKPDQGPQADATFDDAVGEIYRLANRERD
jgi:RNA polymerase sigma factor (sigma-70 family)